MSDLYQMVDMKKGDQLDTRIGTEEKQVDDQHCADHVDVLVPAHRLHSGPPERRSSEGAYPAVEVLLTDFRRSHSLSS